MSRRRVITITSAALLLGILAVVLVAVVSVTQTAFGRDKVRDLLVSQISSRALGKWHVGKVTGGMNLPGMGF